MSLDDLLQDLRENAPELTIRFADFRNNNQEVAAVARLLHGNDASNDFMFSFANWGEPVTTTLNWDPLLHELVTREKLENVAIVLIPIEEPLLLPLFRNQLFQALQQNSNLHSLKMSAACFRNNCSEGFVSFLDGAQGLTNMSFARCGADDIGDARNIAAALSRNNRIQTLEFTECRANLLCPIFRALASADSQSCIAKFVCKPSPNNNEDSNLIAEAMQQYLGSDAATIHCLELRNKFDRNSGTSRILEGLSRNRSVSDLRLINCSVGDEEQARMLADCVRQNANLTALEVTSGYLDSLFEHQVFLNAVVSNLTWRQSPLKCLKIGQGITVTNAVFRNLMTAVSNSRLEHLFFYSLHGSNFHALLEAFPSFRIEKITYQFFRDNLDEEELYLDAIKRNYSVQSVHTLRDGENYLFTGANQSRLDFYLDRNRKLAEWAANPKMVPRNLWQYAMTLALKAGINSLYQSLLALSGQGIGLRQQGRKRKRPQYYKPSS